MGNKKNQKPDEEQIEKKIEELIKKKSDENTALQKLLEGLEKSGSSTKKKIK